MSKKFGNGADLQNQRIINLADPSTPTDAATKQYVDAGIRGLTWKAGVRAASTGNVVKATPGATIDGVTLAVNDRILLKNQTAPQENGIYVWSGAAVALVRSVDADASVELVNATVTVAEGTTLADTTWTQTANAPISVDTTPLAFAPVGGSSSPYTAGNGLSLSGGAFAVNPTAGGGIIADGTGTRVDTAVVTRKYAVNAGDGTTTALTITHNLGTKDVEVTVFDIASGDEELPDVNHTTTNTITVTYAAAPASNAKRVVVQG